MDNICKYYGILGFILQLLLVFFITVYSNYLLISYSAKGVMDFNREILANINLLKFFHSNKIWLNPVIIFSILYVPAIAFFIRTKITKKIETSEHFIVSELLFAFNSIVGKKRKRFSELVGKIPENTKTGLIFNKITKPKQQIIHISEYLQKAFENICVDKTIKVSIVYCENNCMIDYLYMSDDRPSLSISDLNGKSLAKKAIETKEMKIYRKGDKMTDYTEQNRKITVLLCYPIICGKEVLLCINITSKSKHPLKISDAILEYILHNFACRYLLESYLMKIRKELHNEEI